MILSAHDFVSRCTGLTQRTGKDMVTGSQLRIHISLLIRMLAVACVRQLYRQ